MPIDFFNISRSNSTSFSFFSNRRTFTCSGDNFRRPFLGKIPSPNSSSSQVNSEIFDSSSLYVLALRIKTES
ncbi:MAG: Uncharacterised protein [Polaribacter sp. SA4-10]|nr:MAG: Uncharacterised protein [Polaribacter sp. SA4-10]